MLLIAGGAAWLYLKQRTPASVGSIRAESVEHSVPTTQAELMDEAMNPVHAPPAEHPAVIGGRWASIAEWADPEAFDAALLPELDRALGPDADRDPDAGRTPDASDLAGFVSGWLYARWGQDSFEYYDAYMRGNGYVLIDENSINGEAIAATAAQWRPPPPVSVGVFWRP